MKKQRILHLIVALGLATSSYAQFSAGVMGGIGHLSQRQDDLGFGTLIGLDAAQPLLMSGLYGQYNINKKWGLIAGLQLRYQSQQQSQRFTAMNPSNPLELTAPQYNQFAYLVATPYVGIQPFSKLEIAVGPDLSYLLRSQLILGTYEVNRRLLGYNVKATYWLSRLGLEGGYTRQLSYFNKLAHTEYYNSYVYAALKYDLVRKVR